MDAPCGACVFPLNRSQDTGCKFLTPLLIALKNKHKMCSLSWINTDIDVNRTTKCLGRQTPLMLASQHNFTEALKSLLKSGCYINVRDKDGATALSHAVENGNTECVEILIRAGAKTHLGRSNFSPIQSAAYKGYHKILQILIQAGANIDYDNRCCGMTPLMLASVGHHEQCVTELLSAGANVNLPNKYGTTAIGYTQSPNLAKLLLKAGGEVNCEDHFGFTPVLTAVSDGNHPLLKTLIENGGDINKRFLNYDTLLIASAKRGWKSCINILMQHGCDLNEMGEGCQTALVAAGLKGNLDCLRLLLKSNAQINVCQEYHNPSPEMTYLQAEDRLRQEQGISMLFVAGQKFRATKSEHVPNVLKQEKQCTDLKHFCRMSIREHIVKADPNVHLFQQIPKIGLPSLLNDYLLYNISLEDM